MSVQFRTVWLALFLGVAGCSEPPSTLANTVSFETDEGSWMSLDVAPNGEYLVFELLGDLYELPIAGGVAEPLISGREFLSQPRFSPDGATLVFVSDRSGEDNLWLANADGSEPRQLSKRTDGEMISPSWSSDGQTIYVSQLPSRRTNSANVEIWAYPINGNEPELVETPNMGRGSPYVSAFPPGAYGPQVSVNSSDLYFAASTPRQPGDLAGPRAEIMKLNILNGDVEAVSDHSEPTFKPQLSRDGKWLAYGALHDGETGLRLRNLETGDEKWLLRDIGFNGLETWASRDMLPGYSFTAASDAVVIAFGGKMRSVGVADGGLTEIPFHAHVEMDVAPRIAPSVTIDQGPVAAKVVKGAVISPDGEQFAFSAFGRLYRMTLSGQGPDRLTERESFGEFQPAWSPDGTWLAYVTWSATEGGAIWKVRADGGEPAQKLTTDNAYYRNPVWSPDGQTIFAVSAPKILRLENARGPLAGAEQIVSLASNGGKPVAISPAGGIARLHFSEDEQRLYAYSFRLGLSSWKLDGSDQKTHLRVTGSASAASFPAMADDILLSPDGRQALAAVENQLYLIDMSSVSTEQPSVNVYAPGSAYTKITTLGADHFSWANETTLAWSAGSTLYRKAAENDVVEVEALVQQPRSTPSGTIVLRGARIITMEGDTVIGNGDILIDGNRILEVGERGSVNIPETATVIDVHDKTIMPGIVDIHAHWPLKQSVLDLEDYNAYANLAYGVTTIRDPQTFTADIFVYSDAVATGEMIGPRIFSTGRGVFFFNNFQSYEQVYAVLARYKTKYRTHLLKAYLSGSREVRQWVVQACRELDLLVTTEGASDAKMDITFAVDGFSGIEHSIPIVPLHEDIVQLYAQSGISYTPTLLVSFGGPFAVDHFIADGIGLKDQKLHRYMPANLIEQRIARTRFVAPEDHIFPEVASGANEILQAGGSVGLGGHGEMQGLQVHWEMQALSAGGMSNHDVLRVATLESAKAIGLDTDIGSIEAGKLADLVVMDSNPLDDIAHTNSISHVMVNGTLYDANSLAQQWPEQESLPTPWWQDSQ